MDENTLFNAAYDDDAELIVVGICGGLDPNASHPRGGHTPLQAACEADSLRAIKALLENGAEAGKRFTKISRVDGRIICKDCVALMQVQSVEGAKILLEHGANIRDVDAYGWTALSHAVDRHIVDLVLYLIEYGSDINSLFKYMDDIVDACGLLEKKEALVREVMSDPPNEYVIQAIKDYEKIKSILVSVRKAPE
jgi:ankyrin repeat protein